MSQDESGFPGDSALMLLFLRAQAQENVWVAFAMGIMGQKTKYLTSYYPDGIFLLSGRPAPAGLAVQIGRAHV